MNILSHYLLQKIPVSTRNMMNYIGKLKHLWYECMFGYSRPQPQSLLVLFKCNLCWNSQILSRCTSWPSLWNTCHTFTSLASMKSHSLLVYKHEKEGLLCPLSHICLWRATKHYSMNQARINQNQRGFNMESPEICRHSILPETTTMHLFLQRTAVRWKDFFLPFKRSLSLNRLQSKIFF